MLEMDGFKDGYLSLDKEAINWTFAGIPAAVGVDSAIDSAGRLKALALLLPVVAGVTAGSVTSKLTSPGATDVKNLQKSILAAELDETLTELKRKKYFAERDKEDKDAGRGQREIRL